MKAKKSFGQHFLVNDSVARKIIEAAEPDGFDTVVEVGPGRGALTKYIDHESVILIEADQSLVGQLQKQFPDFDLVLGDAAQVDFELLLGSRKWVLVSNLPYNAAGAIIMNALETEHPPQRLVVMVQKEYADRMLAQPGEMGLLSVATQIYSEPRRLMNVKPGSFSPPPKVNSSVLILEVKKLTRQQREQNQAILKLAKAGFSSRRKQLQRNLNEAQIALSERVKNALQAMNLPETARAQELSIENWQQLVKKLR